MNDTNVFLFPGLKPPSNATHATHATQSACVVFFVTSDADNATAKTQNVIYINIYCIALY